MKTWSHTLRFGKTLTFRILNKNGSITNPCVPKNKMSGRKRRRRLNKERAQFVNIEFQKRKW